MQGTIDNQLLKNPLKKSTQDMYQSYHRYFDDLMDSVNCKQIPTVDNILVLIADMVQKKYSAGYIVKTVGGLR